MVTTPTSRSTARIEEDAIFGPPPILENEDQKRYKALLHRVSRAVGPRDFLESIWIRDIVDLTWEVMRWRGFKNEILLDTYNIGMEEKFARLEQIERLSMWAESRRNCAIREIARHREIFAKSLQRQIVEVEAAGYRVIEDKTSAKPITKSAE